MVKHRLKFKSSQKHNDSLVEKPLQDPKTEFRLLLVITKKVPARGHLWKKNTAENEGALRKPFISTPFSSLRSSSLREALINRYRNFRPKIPASTTSAPQPAGSGCSATRKKKHLGPIDLAQLTWHHSNFLQITRNQNLEITLQLAEPNLP